MSVTDVSAWLLSALAAGVAVGFLAVLTEIRR